MYIMYIEVGKTEVWEDFCFIVDSFKFIHLLQLKYQLESTELLNSPVEKLK